MENLTKGKFRDWACTPYAGGGAGPLNAPLWFCGIEPGAAPDSKGGSNGDFERLQERVRSGTEHFSDSYDWDGNLRHRFGQRQAKLTNAIYGYPWKGYEHACRDKPILKLNLYPIAFPSVSDHHWDDNFKEVTGFPSKALYRTWCHAFRFPVLASLVVKESPKIIVGSGISLVSEFITAFASQAGVAEWKLESLPNNGSLRFYSVRFRKVNTLLFVIPFYGRPGALNTDDMVCELGSEIARISAAATGDGGVT